MRTLFSPLALAVFSSLPSAQALPFTPDHPATTFATCAGRLSALMEHQWMFDGPDSEVTKAQRAGMIELLEAVQPEGAGREILHMRIEAKMALATLLTRATFNENAEDARRARVMVDLRMAECTGLLLS